MHTNVFNQEILINIWRMCYQNCEHFFCSFHLLSIQQLSHWAFPPFIIQDSTRALHWKLHRSSSPLLIFAVPNSSSTRACTRKNTVRRPVPAAYEMVPLLIYGVLAVMARKYFPISFICHCLFPSSAEYLSTACKLIYKVVFSWFGWRMGEIQCGLVSGNSCRFPVWRGSNNENPHTVGQIWLGQFSSLQGGKV